MANHETYDNWRERLYSVFVPWYSGVVPSLFCPISPDSSHADRESTFKDNDDEITTKKHFIQNRRANDGQCPFNVYALFVLPPK